MEFKSPSLVLSNVSQVNPPPKQINKPSQTLSACYQSADGPRAHSVGAAAG